MPKVWSLFALATLFSILVSALPTSTSSASNAASSVTAVSKAFPTDAKIGIGIGLAVSGLILVAVCCVLRRASIRKSVNSSNLPRSERTFPRKPRDGPEAEFQDISKLVEFISLYGDNGIVLRELLILASIRYFRSTQSSRMKKASSKEIVSLEKKSKNLNLLQTFTLYATRPEKLVALRDDLVSQGKIIVRQAISQTTHSQDSWAIDGQVWIVEAQRAKLKYAEQGKFYVDLVDIFKTTPDEDSLSIQKRRMELFYNHARLIGIYICQRALATPTRSINGLGISQDSREHFLQMMMRLLTHRHLAGDEKMMRDLQSLLVESDTDPALHPRLYIMWKWAQVKRELESSVQNPSSAVEIIASLKKSAHWSQGLVGLLLADSIQNLERLLDSDALDRVLSWTYEWYHAVYQSRDNEAMSALCILLPRMKLWDKLAGMPERYHLDCGYHLSRLGYPELGERFLASTSTACESGHLGKTWRYRVELLAVTRVGNRAPTNCSTNSSTNSL